MMGNMTRVYRDAFGLARGTPRTAVYQILGVQRPDHGLWETMIVELLTAMNSQNFLLRDTLWGHY